MKSKKLLLSLSAWIIVSLCGILWWFAPVSLMRHINPDNIACIEVTGGDTGGAFSITDPDAVRSIVTNIQNAPLKKSKISLMYSGALFDLTFIDAQGSAVYTLIVNGSTTIRKDPFFYYDHSASICFDLLKELESDFFA